MERRYPTLARLSDRSVVMTGPLLNVILNVDGTYSERKGVVGTRVMIITTGKYRANVCSNVGTRVFLKNCHLIQK